MTNETRRKLSIHPFVGGTTTNLIKSVRQNGGVDSDYRATLALTLVGTLLLFPLRLFERIVFRRRIDDAKVAKDPIFIIGHWRSGTTHLHNVLAHDPSLGYVTTLQAIFPTCCIVLQRCKPLKWLVSLALPEKRMMDNVRLDLDFPQEEEFALSCITTNSHHCNHFPKTIRESFQRYVMFDAGRDEIRSWKENYLKIIKKATYIAGGRRLVLKNPYNTARVRTLLELFPDAKFVHIYRNPYNIYLSAVHDFVKEAEEMALQEFSEEEFSELCFELYEKLMSNYWDSRECIPAHNLYEVAYEEFEKDPQKAIALLYEELGIGDYSKASNSIEAYLKSIGDYKKNRYTCSSELMRRINERWQFAISRLGYSEPLDVAISNEEAWTCQMDY